MIGKLSGLLDDKSPPLVLIDCAGVGYEVLVPMSTFCNLPERGVRVSLLTQLVIREDAHTLYGFASAGERSAFRELLKVSGIGPRTALAILSGLSVAELSAAVTQQQVGRLTKIPGIGKKTAERLLLELKGKLGPDLGLAGATSGVGDATQSDITQALLALGYNEREAAAALKGLPAGAGVSEGIKWALKQLG